MAADRPLFGQRDSELDICVQLIGDLRTRLLLLHGRSGTGKSSFIRAALVPQLLLDDIAVALPQPDSTLETLIIRCTDDPIARIATEFREAIGRDPVLERLSEDERRELNRTLAFRDRENRLSLARRLVDAIGLITRTLDRPLLLIVDQGEEVLSLGARDDDREPRQAFFWFLEELCWKTKIGAKVLFALRTEYYGQFCDSFRLEPCTKLAHGRSGVEQFMLQSLRDEKSIAAAILQPTRSDPIEGLGAPNEFYKFEFEAGLPERIASDLLKHCGESSTLPVMQVVCAQLYERVKNRNESIISTSDYNELGEVAGALDAFVDCGIKSSIQAAKGPNTDRDIMGWREVLGTLVAKQEGGGVTTLIVSKAKLIQSARDSGLSGPIGRIIKEMADERWRLLRPVTSQGGGILKTRREYSLGHDALAIALYQWSQTHTSLADERRRADRRMMRLKMGAIAVLIFACFFGIQLLSQREATLESLRAFALADRSGGFGQRLLMLVASLNQARGPIGFFLKPDESIADLRNTLMRSPIAGGDGDAIGVSMDGQRLAVLLGDKVTVAMIDADQLKQVAEYTLSPSSASDKGLGRQGLNLPRPSTVGFINGLANPVAYKNGLLYYWTEGAARGFELKDLIPEKFLKADFPPWLDISGGVIRVALWKMGKGEFDYMLLRVSTEGGKIAFSSTGPMTIKFRSVFLPIFSQHGPEFAYLDPPSSIAVASLFDPDHAKLVGTENGPQSLDEQGNQASPMQKLTPETFVPSIAFPVNAPGLIVRTEKTSIQYLSGTDGHDRRSFEIPKDIQTDPQKSSFFSLLPLLAAQKSSGGDWRFAWLGLGGIVVMQTKEAEPLGSAAPKPPFLAGVPGLDTIRGLRFSADGRYLTVVAQRRFGDVMKYRVYDLSSERYDELKNMKGNEVAKEGCRVAKIDDASVKQPDSAVDAFDQWRFCP
jgi:hypothetical protein